MFVWSTVRRQRTVLTTAWFDGRGGVLLNEFALARVVDECDRGRAVQSCTRGFYSMWVMVARKSGMYSWRLGYSA